MPVSASVVSRLCKQHPHSASLLASFVPLLNAQENLADSLPAPCLPPLDEKAFAEGKSWLGSPGKLAEICLDPPFLEAAPGVLARAAAEGFPAVQEPVLALGAFLGENPGSCRELAGFVLRGTPGKIRKWAENNAQDEAQTMLLATHLAGAAARRAARAAQSATLPAWGAPLCPVCGGRPHGGAIKGKEGKRYLQCSLCRHEWLFSRTTCPACLQNSPQEIELFFFEGAKQMRAEVCKVCNHYLLCVDTKELVDDTPVELYLLCMMPLDLLMREKKFAPVASQKKRS